LLQALRHPFGDHPGLFLGFGEGDFGFQPGVEQGCVGEVGAHGVGGEEVGVII